MTNTLAIIAAGAMGSAIARRMAENGARVLTSLKGRSQATVDRAHQAGMISTSDQEIAAHAELVLSVVPPGEALALAERLQPVFERQSRRPIFMDCNAVNPSTLNRQAAGTVVDRCVPILRIPRLNRQAQFSPWFSVVEESGESGREPFGRRAVDRVGNFATSLEHRHRSGPGALRNPEAPLSCKLSGAQPTASSRRQLERAVADNWNGEASPQRTRTRRMLHVPTRAVRSIDPRQWGGRQAPRLGHGAIWAADRRRRAQVDLRFVPRKLGDTEEEGGLSSLT
jgi:hypothetical protein